jgi:GTP-binding protein
MNNKELLKIFNDAMFVAGASSIASLPNLELPQIAFVGRSNVGKSTLINTICARKKLVKTSKSPGHTKQINFFNIQDIFTLVDLPGYGFSSVSHKVKENWSKLIWHYLQNNKNLRLVNLLLDFRRDLRESDLILIHMLQKLSINWQAVITKADKAAKHESNIPNIISAVTQEGCSAIKVVGLGMEEVINDLRLSILLAARSK